MSKRSYITLVLLVLIASLIAMASTGCSGKEESTPTPEPPTAVPEETETVWDRIQKSGTLVVGTSADYPPFAYYDRNQKLDGFDIALIQEIGRRLGLHVDIHDFAFDGLGGALQLGQVDTAIAAISYTPERDAVVDFSDVYFVSNDAVLAAEGGVQTVAEAKALGGYRVGVQSGTVHEQWLRSTLIDSSQFGLTLALTLMTLTAALFLAIGSYLFSKIQV